jgi:hypothetical protein
VMAVSVKETTKYSTTALTVPASPVIATSSNALAGNGSPPTRGPWPPAIRCRRGSAFRRQECFQALPWQLPPGPPRLNSR